MEILEIIVAFLSFPALVFLLVSLFRVCREVAQSEIEERQSMVNLLDKIAQRLEDEKKK